MIHGCTCRRILSLSFSRQNPFNLSLLPIPLLTLLFSFALSFSQARKEEEEEARTCFDRLPDDLLFMILNKVQDAKSLIRCLPVCKRLASLIPKMDFVSLLFTPPPPWPDPGTEAARWFWPHRCLRNTFNDIKSLRLVLHGYNRDVILTPKDGGPPDCYNMKWKAIYDSELRRCVMLCATSFGRGKSKNQGTPPPPPPLLTAEEQNTRMFWALHCVLTAWTRKEFMKQTLINLKALKRVEILDTMKQGKLCMEEQDIWKWRDSNFREDNNTEVWTLKMWHAPELELPASGYVMKEVTLVDIRYVQDMDINIMDHGFDGDETERVVFEEAQREIMNLNYFEYEELFS